MATKRTLVTSLVNFDFEIFSILLELSSERSHFFQTLDTTQPEETQENDDKEKFEAEKQKIELEKEELTKQLLQAKQKHLELLSKVEGLQAQAPEVSELESLKHAKSALEKKFVEIIDQNASIKDENEKLEALVHQLSAETDTIIEYVALYRKGCIISRRN